MGLYRRGGIGYQYSTYAIIQTEDHENEYDAPGKGVVADMDRMIKTALHELGHMLGLMHEDDPDNPAVIRDKIKGWVDPSSYKTRHLIGSLNFKGNLMSGTGDDDLELIEEQLRSLVDGTFKHLGIPIEERKTVTRPAPNTHIPNRNADATRVGN